MTKDEIDLELFKLYVATAEKVSDRRGQVNSWMISVHSLISGAFGFLQSGQYSVNSDFEKSVWLLAIPLSGIIVCVSWIRLLESARLLNYAKFVVIQNFEKKFDQLYFKMEQIEYKSAKLKKPRISFSVSEKFVPYAFLVLYCIMLAGSLVFHLM